jgi:hypothetical protein
MEFRFEAKYLKRPETLEFRKSMSPLETSNSCGGVEERTWMIQSVVSRLLLVCVCAACPVQVMGFDGERWIGGASSPLYGGLSPYLSVKRITSTVRCPCCPRCPRCPRCQRDVKLLR